jgi:hypothetical protein
VAGKAQAAKGHSQGFFEQSFHRVHPFNGATSKWPWTLWSETGLLAGGASLNQAIRLEVGALPRVGSLANCGVPPLNFELKG